MGLFDLLKGRAELKCGQDQRGHWKRLSLKARTRLYCPSAGATPPLSCCTHRRKSSVLRVPAKRLDLQVYLHSNARPREVSAWNTQKNNSLPDGSRILALRSPDSPYPGSPVSRFPEAWLFKV